MLRIHQLKLPLAQAQDINDALLRRLCAERLRLQADQIVSVKLQKRSVDARDKGDVYFSLTVDAALKDGAAEQRLAAKYKPNQLTLLTKTDAAPDLFTMPLPPWPKGEPAPVVVGAGPAGLFCALALAARGAKPLLIERGQPVEKRALSVEAFERDGCLDSESNVLFGEGGAGAFSDGKLTCGLNSPHIRTVLQTLYACGAPEDILTAQRPHIGTDVLRQVLVSARKRLTALGGDVRFGCRLTGLVLSGGTVTAIRMLDSHGETELPASRVYLAIGHSARDTYEWLCAAGVPMEQKPFAIGARIEHLQANINRSQYGGAAGHPALPPADYKLNVPTPDGRGVYTFCMCPGGHVIGAASEAGGLNVNGMSLHARNGINANAALLVGVKPEDFGSDHPLAGVEFQRRIERAAFAATAVGGGAGERVTRFKAPCQRVEDLLLNRETKAFGEVHPSYRPGVVPGDLRCCLPDFVIHAYQLALPLLGKRLRGFDAADALLTGPETRSSSPLRMIRDQRRESSIGGLYPLGEGAGYAGGIVSAAMDGMLAGMDEIVSK